MTNKNNIKAFTLIELLIVIVIIGILAGVVLAVIRPEQVIRRAQETSAKAVVVKACLSYNACLKSSYDGAGVSDGTKCDTAAELGLNATTWTTGYGGTFAFYTAAASATCASGATCRPGWRSANCHMLCNNATNSTNPLLYGAGTTAGTSCLVQ